MYLRNARRQQVERMRRHVAWQIERNGIEVKAFIPIYVNDSMNGKIMQGKNEICLKGILINSSAGSLNDMTASDSSRTYNGTQDLWLLHDHRLGHNLEYLITFFVDKKQYRVVKVENIDSFDLVYKVSVKYTNSKMEGYNSVGKK